MSEIETQKTEMRKVMTATIIFSETPNCSTDSKTKKLSTIGEDFGSFKRGKKIQIFCFSVLRVHRLSIGAIP